MASPFSRRTLAARHRSASGTTGRQLRTESGDNGGYSDPYARYLDLYPAAEAISHALARRQRAHTK